MFRTLSILFLLFLLFQACKSDPRPGEILRRLAPPPQVFHLKTGRDTTITCANGTIISFCKNTFQTGAKEVIVEVREVFTRADMLRNGLSTVTTDGTLLSSEGMLFLNVSSPVGTTINADCPVSVRVPTRGFRPAALFNGRSVTSGVVWENAQPLHNNEELKRLIEGQRLFCESCASCHNDSLALPLTGPALGRVGDWRTRQWLLDFTRNSQRMIAAGDPEAVCLWNKWKPSVMTSFSYLSDREIESIYAFIETESARQNVIRDADDFDCSAAGRQRQIDNRTFYYLFSMNNYGWVNVDCFWQENPSPVPFLVEIADAERYDDLSVALVFDRRNVTMQLEPVQGGFGFAGKPKAPLPPDPVHLYAIGLRGDKFYVDTLATSLSADNRFKLRLKRISEKELLERINTVEQPVSEVVDWCKFNHALQTE